MANISISSLTVGELAVNCWFLANEDTKEVLVIDPGDEEEQIRSYIEKNGWTMRAILLTHGHYDHIGAVEELRRIFNIPVYAMQEEEELLLDAKKNLSVYTLRRVMTLSVDKFLKDGEELDLAGLHVKVIFTPGHTPGGCSYYCEEAKSVFSGDTLFCGSVGRTDFPGGSMAAICHSVKDKLLVLPAQTRVLPGHGEASTIEFERRMNPYVT